ncbi:MAG TPA: hypothetical protein VKC89_01305 [Patescibacteria group bacterium]|nr:hypothetical protein [Patescibacteria group bacterium]
MTVETLPYPLQGVHEKPPPLFSLKPTLSTEDIRQIESPETETLAQIIEQVHPDRSAFTTVRSLIDTNHKVLRPSPLIHETDPYAVIALESLAPQLLQRGRIIIPRTLKDRTEARIDETNTREFVWLNNEMPELYVRYLGVVNLEELRLRTKLSQTGIDGVISDLTPVALESLDKNPDFVVWAGSDWKSKGVPMSGALGGKGIEPHVSYFGSTPQGGPSLFLRIGSHTGEGLLFQKGNNEAKFDGAKISRIMYWSTDRKVMKDTLGAAEASASFIKGLVK